MNPGAKINGKYPRRQKVARSRAVAWRDDTTPISASTTMQIGMAQSDVRTDDRAR